MASWQAHRTFSKIQQHQVRREKKGKRKKSSQIKDSDGKKTHQTRDEKKKSKTKRKTGCLLAASYMNRIDTQERSSTLIGLEGCR